MPTRPNRVRATLRRIANRAAADTRAVVASAESPTDTRAALFAAVPLIVGDYTDGSSALALDWYEELRDDARVAGRFVPSPLTLVREDDLAAAVAQATKPLYDLEADLAKLTEEMLAQATSDSLILLDGIVQQNVTTTFNETILKNTHADPGSVGWKRFARPEACKFCLMLAARGAVYTEQTARFAAHGATTNGKRTGGDCMCIAGPEFGGKETWAEAIPLQYVASRRKRTDAERAALRAYLNKNYPNAPG